MTRAHDGTLADGGPSLAVTRAHDITAGEADAPGRPRFGSAAPTVQALDADTLLAAGVPTRPPPEPVEIERGAQVGRYVVLSRLGAGGMGVVYAGYDPELDRKVALKLLRAASDHDLAASVGRTRLLREAQALAKLSHPHVVAVFDVGTLGDRVWLAMEYVDGQTLGTWLESQKPRWRDVLEVMTAVGRGLAAAHAAGLVHRDLKPDNIMVGSDGRVRVMDFGLARASGQPDLPATDALMLTSLERGALNTQVTQVGAVMGTPAYMAPEQWRGDQVDAAADQFAYCVTLWEALFGARPFDGDSLAALAAAVMSGELRPPPRRARVPAWLRRVVQRGLQAEPGRRFPSMDALLAALARGRARVRLARLAVGLGAAAVAAAAVPVWHDHERAQRIADCEARAADIAPVWNDVARARLGEALRATRIPYAETTFARATPWIDRWASEWARLRVQVCRETEVEGTRSAALRERADACLDERREELEGLLAVLGEDAATAVLRAVNAAASLSPLAACSDRATLERRPDPPADPEVRARVVELRRDMMRVQGLHAAGRYLDGLERAEALLAAAEQVGHAPLVVEASLLVGNLAEKAQRFDRAETALIRAYVDGGAGGADDIAARAAIDLVVVKGQGQAKFEAGIDWSRSAEMWLRRLDRTDDVLGAKFANALAIAHKMRGDFDRAQELYERALAIRERALGADHPDVAMLLNNLANLQQARGDVDAVLPLYRRALASLERTFGPDHPHVAYVLNNFGATLYYRGEYDEAGAMYHRALAIREPIYGPDAPEVIDLVGNVAVLLTARGADAEATGLYRRVLAVQERQLEPTHPKIADTLGNLALALRRQRDLDGALAAEERALAIREGLGAEHVDVAHSLTNLGAIHLARLDPDRAAPLLRRAVAIREKALDPDSHELAETLHVLGEAHLARDDFAAAEPVLERALAIREKVMVADSPITASTRHRLAEVRRLQGDLDAAQALEERALASFERHAEAAAAEFALPLVGLGEIALARGRPADALPLLERALAHGRDEPGFDLDLAETRFALARALRAAPAAAAGDPARARRLALQAADTYRAAGAPLRRHLAAVEAWLKRHPR